MADSPESATLVTPTLTMSPGDPGTATGVITNITTNAVYTILRTYSSGVPAIESPLYQSTTFTVTELASGVTFIFTTTATMSDGTSATSAPVTITIN